MKQIDVKNQKRLSMKRCFDLVISGVQFRLFRAAITVAIVALAVAFLMTMLTESLTAREVARAMETETAPRELLLYWVDRVTNPMGPAELTDELAAIDVGGPRWREFATWGSLRDEQLTTLKDVAQSQLEYREFFSGLDEGEIRPLVGRARGHRIYEHLQTGENWERFVTELPNLNTQLPTSQAEFESFLSDWKDTQPLRQAIIAGQSQAIAKAEEVIGDPAPTEFFATAEPETILQLETFGYVLPKDSVETIREQAGLVRHVRLIERTLMVGVIKNRLAGERNAATAEVTADMLFDHVDGSTGAEWLVEQVTYVRQQPIEIRQRIENVKAELAKQREIITDKQETLAELQAADDPDEQEIASTKERLAAARQAAAGAQRKLNKLPKELAAAEADAQPVAAFDIGAERIVTAADYREDQKSLRDVESSIVAATVGTSASGFLGFSTRTMWLVIVSFVVCVVGIANAMLMSVTERFREIATMKCLGATDGFIMINFILESCMQGLAGGLIGTVLGLLLGLLRGWAGYGFMALSNFPLSQVLAIGGVSLVMGIVLSAIAAVYPAWVAARLAPMEAMRIE
ncbi:MAG: FtsX-like permease family protein [Planctomycetes bacterium]|jgi:hypothetical protein|nr:FtsX-like permease family protein [Phycisphaerae bacterium]NBB95600.1 FtsX-like permease family protein [Planctomycetota bacterium]